MRDYYMGKLDEDERAYILSLSANETDAKNQIVDHIMCYYPEADASEFDVEMIFEQSYEKVGDNLYFKITGIMGILDNIKDNYKGSLKLAYMWDKSYSELIRMRNDFKKHTV